MTKKIYRNQAEIKLRLMKAAMMKQYSLHSGSKWLEEAWKSSILNGFSPSTTELALDLAIEELIQLHAAYMADMSPVHASEPDDREWEDETR